MTATARARALTATKFFTTMPPKRKDASRKVVSPAKATTESVTAIPASNGSPADVVKSQSLQTDTARAARARIFRRLFRVFMLGSVLMWAKPRLFPSKTASLNLQDVAGSQQAESYEEIRLDPAKRNAIQTAFKVGSAVSHFAYHQYAHAFIGSIRGQPMSGMHSGSTSEPCMRVGRGYTWHHGLTQASSSYHPISHRGSNMSPKGPVG